MALLLELIEQYKGDFKVSFSITGGAIEQFREYAPEVLDSFKKLAKTGCVEFLAETSSHSLASLKSETDCKVFWKETYSVQEYGAYLFRQDWGDSCVIRI